MGWSNLVYFLVGLGLGLGSRSIWQVTRSQLGQGQSAKVKMETCLEQLIQTQLAYQMASEMSKFKEGFLARVSHELRSPINGIVSIHQLITEGLCQSKSEEQELLEEAHHRTRKLIEFIDEMVLVA